jgi:hypothetical protein
MVERSKEQSKRDISKILERKENRVNNVKTTTIKKRGGRAMSDEACPTYGSVITDMTMGHRFIKETFGEEYLPKYMWSIDPFGASSALNRVYKEMGFLGTVN